MNERLIMLDERDHTVREQMELTLEDGLILRRRGIRRRRPSRAHWWFRQMRHVVEEARDYEPAPPARIDLDIPLMPTRFKPRGHRESGI